MRWLSIVGILIFSTISAHGLPRFAAATGFKCQSCHVDPSGGAMRAPNGVQYGREQLPVPEWAGDNSIEDFSNILGSVVGIGADFRSLYFFDHYSGKNSNAFWQMQGDLYLTFRVAKKVHLFLNKGLYSGFEAFGLLNLLPLNGYVKIGKFLPTFGLRTDDHTTYARTYTGFSPEVSRPELTGLEVGIFPGPLSFVGGIFNAGDGFGATTASAKAILGRAEALASISESVHLTVGGSVFHNAIVPDALLQRLGEVENVSSLPVLGVAKSTVLCGFGSLKIGGLVVLGEGDWIRIRSASPTIKGIACTVEADYPLHEGLVLQCGYDFIDPDTDRKTGAATRYTVGLELFPLSGVELRPVYHLVDADHLDLRSEFLMMVHLYL